MANTYCVQSIDRCKLIATICSSIIWRASTIIGHWCSWNARVSNIVLDRKPIYNRPLSRNTAYFGFLEICEPKIGETVVVSGAAGAVGSLVGQIAKIKGCTVIGIAGSDDKCEWLKTDLGFDHVINYKKEDIAKSLHAAAPNGVDCYFDNVGGEMSSTVLSQMNLFGRISCCGSISSYNFDSNDRPKVTVIQNSVVFKQLKMEGFIVSRWNNRWMEGIRQMLKWIKDGKIKFNETFTEGFENIPTAFIEMLQGKNVGKAVVKV